MTMNKSLKTSLMIYGCGILYDLMYAVFLHSSGKTATNTLLSIPIANGVVITPIMPFVLDLYRRFSHLFLSNDSVDKIVDSRFYQYESITYLFVPLATLLLLTGIRPNSAFTLAVFIFFIFIQVGLLWFTLDAKKRQRLVCSEKFIAVLFLISGFSALIYQVVWQRILFTTFGVNSESVTIIVSVFMFGLGMGSLLGGCLQKKFADHLLQLFLIIETSIGLYGLVSLHLIDLAGDFSATESLSVLFLRVYGVLVIPTLLMGATLPILVAFLQNHFHNIGKTVGLLYAFNTMGSAIAAFLTVELLFVLFGQQTTIVIAAFCNFITAYLIFKASRQFNQTTAESSSDYEDIINADKKLSFGFAFVTLFAIGYISLSQEILWFRLLGFMSANRPQVFGLLLTAFLIGIASGALNSKKNFECGSNYYRYLICAVISAAVLFYFAFPLIFFITSHLGKGYGMFLTYLLVALVAYFSGGILPILMHAGIDKKSMNSASKMSWLYFANILGSTAGPLLTGFILLDFFSLEMNVVILSIITLLLLLNLLLFLSESTRFKLSTISVISVVVVGAVLYHPILYREYLEKIQYASTQYQPFKYQIENRGGILTVEKGNADIMYGHGIYDGRFNTDLINNSNRIDRAYMIAAFHRQPKKILEIGVSTGSWARIFVDYSPLEHMTMIEINKGYPKIIQNYPDIASMLAHPKLELFYDDGRRWLRNHPEQKFDMIVMNTTFYWRSNSTNMLSVEFLQLCKQHLNQGGVVYYNTTGSEDIPYTAAHVFNYVTMYNNFVAASDAPFHMSIEEKKQNLLNFKFNTADTKHYEELIKQLAIYPLPELRQELLSKNNLWLITDDNMATEYKVD
jgi:spermidine synthase